MTGGGWRYTGWISRWKDNLTGLFKEVQDDSLNAFRDRLEENLMHNARKGGERGLSVRTGALIGGITVYRLPGNSGVAFRVGKWGELHNRGAVITPRKGEFLTFYIPGVGWRRSRRVVLPARMWIDDAVRDTNREYPAMMAASLARIASGARAGRSKGRTANTPKANPTRRLK